MRNMMTVYFKCQDCGEEYAEDYERIENTTIEQNIERIWYHGCPECHSAKIAIRQAIPYTEHYRSSSLRIASFRDEE